MRVLLRRLGFYLLAAWVALTVNFFLPRLVPGNPVATAIGHLTFVNAQVVDAIKAQFGVGINDSIWIQYVHYWGDLIHGNLGVSWGNSFEPVTSLIGAALPWTLGLLGVATVVSFLLGTFIGIGLGWMRSPWLDWLIPGATFFQAIPYFFLGTVLLMAFATGLHWFPISQGYQTTGVESVTPGLNWAYLVSLIDHGVLPASTIVLTSIAGWMLGMRNMMVITMDEDFVLVARAKGLPARKVVWYAARNAILPSVANFSLAISLVVAGQLLVEIVFSYPGIGYLLFHAVTNQDYPMVQGIFLVITLVVLLANFLADIVYVSLDPRVRQEA
ncbi:MAG TPA: ABC transporter permease [Candidatus Saccharimonadales bacterium]|nr:ABC transporter permease [Candidatus Saccharimonadales bacterium]